MEMFLPDGISIQCCSGWSEAGLGMGGGGVGMWMWRGGEGMRDEDGIGHGGVELE